MKNTKIAWCDHTFNPWIGCEKKSEGCENCYAKSMHERWNGKGSFAKRIPTSDANWLQPARWSIAAEKMGKLARVFVGSMCDWLDLRAPDEVRCELLNLVLDERMKIEWLLLTKRPECWSTAMIRAMKCARAAGKLELAQKIKMWVEGATPKRVWFGVTAENQDRWYERTVAMQTIPADVRWVSVEPMLGPVHALTSLGDVDWVVAGGENGPGARECRAEWIVDLSAQCREIGVPFFFKQWGKKTDVELAMDCMLKCAQVAKTQQWPE